MELEWQEIIKQISDDKQINDINALIKETKKSVKEGVKLATRELKARSAKVTINESAPVTKDSKPWKLMDSCKTNVLHLNDQPSIL